MSDRDSSDEDVFECGRCKEKFFDMTVFMQHKKEKTCQKIKKHVARPADDVTCSTQEGMQETMPTAQPAAHTGSVLEGILNDSMNSGIPERQLCEDGGSTMANISPSISEIFASKVIGKEINNLQQHLGIDLLNALDQANKQVVDSSSVDCVLCQEWLPNQQEFERHLQEKHDIVPQSEQLPLDEVVQSENQSSSVELPPVNIEESTATTSRRARPDHACSVCHIKFLSRFKLEQHFSSRKHRSAVKQIEQGQGDGKNKDSVPKRPGRPTKRCSCSVCGLMLNSVKALQQHMKENHKHHKQAHDGKHSARRVGGGNQRKYRQKHSEFREKLTHKAQGDDTKDLCRECGILVATKSLLRHERRCANRKRFECPLCKHQSRERTEYVVHIDNHKVWVKVDKTEYKPEWDPTIKTKKKQRSQPVKNPGKSVDTTVDDASPGVDKDTNMTLSPADLAVLGLMPKPQNIIPEGMDAADNHSQNREQFEEDVRLENKGFSEGDDFTVQGDEDDDDDYLGESDNVKLHSKQLKCRQCVKWYVRSNLPRHMYEKHSLVKQFQCRDTSCLQMYTNVNDFRDHILIHSDKLMFKCGCRYCIKNKQEVDEEYTEGVKRWKMRQYYSQLSYKCNLCWMKFPNEKGLKKHQLTEPHQHICDLCGKVMVSKRQLRLHKVSHQEERGYLCDMCGQGFKTDRDLKKHIASHSTERPYVCKECHKGFIFKNKLTRHYNTVHAAKKPHVCVQPGCKKSFARKDKLKDHLKTHLSTPPYVCRYCPKGFYRKDSCRDHEVLHTKEFPYRCPICDKGFTRPKGLKHHQTREHGRATSPKLAKLLKQSEVVQNVETTDAPSPAQVNFVLYDQNAAAVLEGTASTLENEAQALQALSAISFNQASTTEAQPSGLGYQMTYQMPSIDMSDTNGLQVTLSQALAAASSQTQ